MTRRRPLLGAAAAACLPALALAGVEAPAQERVPDVGLLDHRGRSVRLRSLCAEHTVAVNFIFTGCSSFCPPQTAVFREVQARWSELRALRPAPLLVSLSLDPLADTPQALTRYAQRFDARLGREEGWLMLTGDVASMAHAALAFDAGGPNLADHPSRLWVGARNRWLSATGFVGPEDVLRLMRRASA